MPLDGITLRSTVHELSETLEGGRVDKIQQPEPDEIVIAIRSKGHNHKLLLTANANSPRIHFTNLTKPNPDQAPMFCMLLRKHLGGGRIIKIIQPDYERIVELYIESPNEMGDLSTKCLIIEIMGKHSNIMLVDAHLTIMDSIRHISRELSSVREILPGRPYIRPPSQGKVSPVLSPTPYSNEGSEIKNIADDDSKKYFLSLFDKPENAGKRAQQIIYQSYNGISPVIGSEICLRADIPPETFPEVISKPLRERLLHTFIGLYTEIEECQFDCRIYEGEKNGEKRDFSAIPLNIYASMTKSDTFASPSEMLETFYQGQDKIYRLKQKTSDLKKLVQNHLDRCLRKDEIHQVNLQETQNKEEWRKFGELITAYIHEIPKGADRAQVPDYYNEDTNMKMTEIPLDPALTPAENAQRYFKNYNKAKRRHQALEEQMTVNATDIAYLDSVLAAIGTVADEADIAEIRAELADQGFLKKGQGILKGSQKGKKGQAKQRQVKAKPLHYRSSEGYDIYVGKNNTQNDELTLRFAQSNDIWLHTKDIAGSHVIIQANGKNIPDQTIIEGAMLAAYHSKAQQSSQVPVDYVARKHVRKPKGAKPGFVIYDYHNTIYVTPEENKLPSVVS